MNTASADTRPGLYRQAIRLEQFSIGWMLIEASVAVTAGAIAGSLALTSFGFDSVIELVSAVLVLRRLCAELTDGQASEDAERRVLRIIAVTFFALGAYVTIGSVIDLATGARPEHSPVGIGLTLSSLLVMPLLGWRKRRVGALLGNPLVQADAAETTLCATLAGTTLLGLVLFAALGWWQADPIAALAVAYFAVREGREAWHGELACDEPAPSPDPIGATHRNR
jgi:divalent metal cation (Fe/Co/Zn/Cd) transporter